MTKIFAFIQKDDKAIKEKLKKVFMTNDELRNVQFIPTITSHQSISKVPEDAKELTFDEKFGANFSKSDPAIYKKGILKKAWRLFNEGKYLTASNTLEVAFNIESLKNYHDPEYYKRKLK